MSVKLSGDDRQRLAVTVRSLHTNSLSGRVSPPLDLIAVAALVALWTAMVALVDPIGDFPLNDDWIYGAAAKLLARSGDFRIPGPTVANSLSQVVWGAFFCLPDTCSFTVLRFSTLSLGLMGVLAFYAAAREIGGDVKTGLIAAMTLAVNPFYFALANSFMTDVPFVASSVIAIYFFVRGFRRNSRLSLVVGCALTLVALLDRQLALALPFGLAVAFPFRFGCNPRFIMLGLIPLGVGMLLHLGYQHWLVSTGHGAYLLYPGTAGLVPQSLTSFATGSLRLSFLAAPYIGLFALPSLLALPSGLSLRLAPQRGKVVPAGCGAVALASFCVLCWRNDLIPSIPNVLITSGVGPLTLRDTFLLDINLPVSPAGLDIFWMGVTALGCVGIYLIASRLVLSLTDVPQGMPKPADRPLVALCVFLAASVGSYWCALLLFSENSEIYDRYLLFIVPVSILLMIALTMIRESETSNPGRRWRRRAAASIPPLLILGFAAFSVAATHDYLAWNRARWRATDELMQNDHVPPEKIDGGYEFGGLFLYHAGYQRRKDESYWWVADDEYIIASGSIRGYRQVRRYPYHRWLPFSGPGVVVLQRLARSAADPRGEATDHQADEPMNAR